MARAAELFRLIGRGVIAVVLGFGLSIYGLVTLIVSSEEVGWFWVALGLGSLFLTSVWVAYKALEERDEARKRQQEDERKVPQGGPSATGIAASGDAQVTNHGKVETNLSVTPERFHSEMHIESLKGTVGRGGTLGVGTIEIPADEAPKRDVG